MFCVGWRMGIFGSGTGVVWLATSNFLGFKLNIEIYEWSGVLFWVFRLRRRRSFKLTIRGVSRLFDRVRLDRLFGW